MVQVGLRTLLYSEYFRVTTLFVIFHSDVSYEAAVGETQLHNTISLIQHVTSDSHPAHSHVAGRRWLECSDEQLCLIRSLQPTFLHGRQLGLPLVTVANPFRLR